MISVNPNDGDFEGTIWFDYFKIVGAISSSQTSVTTAGPTSVMSATTSSSASQKVASGHGQQPTEGYGHGSHHRSSIGSRSLNGATMIKHTNASAVSGGVIGGQAFFILAAVVLFFVWRKRRQQSPSPAVAHPDGKVPAATYPSRLYVSV